METGNWSWEQKTLISEIIQGMELTKQLKLQLNETSSGDTRDVLLQGILCSYEKALLILNWNGSTGQPQHVAIPNSVPQSPISMDESPRSDDIDGVLQDNHKHYYYASKKRKTMPKWTDQVRVGSENGLEGPHDDGYSWRKYGQKDILGAKYPRSYYRCSHKNTRNCCARKQVQRSDDDPLVFDITYHGVHTCSQGQQPVPPATSRDNLEQKQISNNNCQFPSSHETLFTLRKGLTVDTEGLENAELSHFGYLSTHGCNKVKETSYSPFQSPATPEPNPFHVSPFQTNNFRRGPSLQSSDSDVAEIVSASTSATNSPILDFDFPLEHLNLDPNFPFDTPGLFC